MQYQQRQRNIKKNRKRNGCGRETRVTFDINWTWIEDDVWFVPHSQLQSNSLS